MCRKYSQLVIIIIIIQLPLMFSFDFFSTNIDSYVTIFEGAYPPLGGKVINMMYSIPVMIVYTKYKRANPHRIISFENKQNFAREEVNKKIIPTALRMSSLILLSFILLLIFSYDRTMYLNLNTAVYMMSQYVIISLYIIVILLLYTIASICFPKKVLALLITYIGINVIYVYNFRFQVIEYVLDIGVLANNIKSMSRQAEGGILLLVIIIIVLYITLMKSVVYMEVIDEVL